MLLIRKSDCNFLKCKNKQVMITLLVLLLHCAYVSARWSWMTGSDLPGHTITASPYGYSDFKENAIICIPEANHFICQIVIRASDNHLIQRWFKLFFCETRLNLIINHQVSQSTCFLNDL